MAMLSRRPQKSSKMSMSASDWTIGEDDAWDSASDSESPQARATTAGSPSRPIPVAPNNIRRKSSNDNNSSSSSNLAFSYTHINAPTAASYQRGTSITRSPQSIPSAPRRSDTGKDKSSGWTIVRTASTQPGKDDEVTDEIILSTELNSESQNLHTNRAKEGKVSVKLDVDDIVNDPLHAVTALSTTEYEEKVASGIGHPGLQHQHAMKAQRRQKFVECLTAEDVNIADLRKLAWSGIPEELRPLSWQLLLGYIPLSANMRTSVLARKRDEYASLVRLTFARGIEGLDQQIWHQIEIDVPRTRPGVRLWMERGTQRSLERILYVWAIRHPTSGYVQGINDLVTPFFQIFLGAYIDSDPEQFDPSLLPEHVLTALEADSFWCLSRLLDGIQDNYISAQPGIHRSVKHMAELVARIDPALSKHLASQNVEFMQFAFRWMNCLLMRELSVRNTIRMWDTYLSEGGNAFSEFHLYVCCAFLISWSEKLREMDFQGIIMFLQSLPTQTWGDHEIELLLAEAYVLSSVWHNAQSHLLGKGG